MSKEEKVALLEALLHQLDIAEFDCGREPSIIAARACAKQLLAAEKESE